jgi:hypothetical protein
MPEVYPSPTNTSHEAQGACRVRFPGVGAGPFLTANESRDVAAPQRIGHGRTSAATLWIPISSLLVGCRRAIGTGYSGICCTPLGGIRSTVTIDVGGMTRVVDSNGTAVGFVRPRLNGMEGVLGGETLVGLFVSRADAAASVLRAAAAMRLGGKEAT